LNPALMIRMKKVVIAMIAYICLSNGSPAQDLHFSQFMNSPLTTNPANTGFIPNADYRIGGNYRSQWTSLPAPFITGSVWADFQVLRNKLSNGWMGIGALVLHDLAGSGQLRSDKQYLSVAYHQMLGYSSLLSGGFNLGLASKRIDINRYRFDNQWNGRFFDAKIPNGELAFQQSNISYFDMQAGLNYAYFPSEKTYLNLGLSVHHLNRPKESFLGSDNEVPERIIGFVNGSFKLNDMWIINPNAYYSLQARASEMVLGMNAAYNVTGDGQFVLIGGAYYRWNDAAVAMIGFERKNISVTFTYDATISLLSPYNNGKGAYEFSLIKRGYYNQLDRNLLRQSMCPQF
jgi:type IX secretion system PorP/SprF family membrane protein